MFEASYYFVQVEGQTFREEGIATSEDSDGLVVLQVEGFYDRVPPV